MAGLEMRFLGGFVVTRDGEVIRGFDTDKTRALLAYLAVETDHPHRREVLASLFWPNRPDQAARTSLRQALYRLRQALGYHDPSILLMTRQDIRLNAAAGYYLDVDHFTNLLTHCHNHAANHQELCACCACWRHEAVALYQGDFLAGLAVRGSEAFETWLLSRQELFHHLAMDALHSLAAYHQAHQNYLDALGFGQRLIELEPWHEGGHRVLMRVLAQAGQRSAALHQFEVCRGILTSELGVAPSARTTRLYEAIRDENMADQLPAEQNSRLDSAPALRQPQNISGN